MLSTLTAFAVIAGVVSATWNPVRRQYSDGETLTVTRTLFPTGVQETNYRISSTFPLACVAGCQPANLDYFSCFVVDLPGVSKNQTACDQALCDASEFSRLYECLNCIIANGGENTTSFESITASPSAIPSGAIDPAALQNPNGPIDLDQANAILANVTRRCESIGTTLSGGTSITASPTTTGPYQTSWASGETASLTIWPGLETFSIQRDSIITTTMGVSGTSAASAPSGAVSNTANSGGNAGSSINPSGTSQAATAGSTTGAADLTSHAPFNGLIAGLLAWAVLV